MGCIVLTVGLSSSHSGARNCHKPPFDLQRNKDFIYMPGCSLVLTRCMKSTPPGVTSITLSPSLFLPALHALHRTPHLQTQPLTRSYWHCFSFSLRLFFKNQSLVPTLCIKISQIIQYKFVKHLLWSRHTGRHFIYIKFLNLDNNFRGKVLFTLF